MDTLRALQGEADMSKPLVGFVADTGAGLLILGSFAGYIPTIAAMVGMIWYAVQIWESDTVRQFTGRKTKD